MTEILEPFSEASESPVAKAKAKAVTGGNGRAPGRVEYIRVSKKLAVKYVSFSRRQSWTKFVKPEPDGSVRDDKLRIHYKLDPQKLWDGGATAYVDADRGLHIEPTQDSEWVGMSGHETWEWDWGKIFGALAVLKSGELLKWAKLAVILTAVTLAALIISVVVLAGQVGA